MHACMYSIYEHLLPRDIDIFGGRVSGEFNLINLIPPPIYSTPPPPKPWLKIVSPAGLLLYKLYTTFLYDF
jgi:hypothetical protein